MMRDLVNIINDYAKEEGYKVFGTRFTGKGFYFDLDIYRQHVNILFNGNNYPLYQIANTKDCVKFCLVLTSLDEIQQFSGLM